LLNTLLYSTHSVDEQLTTPLFNREQLADRNFESASSDLMMRAEKTNRSLRITFFDVVWILEKRWKACGFREFEVGLLDQFNRGCITAVLDDGRKKPKGNSIGSLIVDFDALNGFEKQEGTITSNAIASHLYVDSKLNSPDYDQSEGKYGLSNSWYKLSGDGVRMSKSNYIADEHGAVYFPLLEFIVILISVPVSIVEIMIAVSQYYRGSRKGAAILFIVGACTTPVAFLWFFVSLVSENASAPHGACCVSPPTSGLTEGVGIVSIVIPQIRFRNAGMQIFAADLVISHENPSLMSLQT
jgi:hypothetical protein